MLLPLIPLASNVAPRSPFSDRSDCRGRIEGVFELPIDPSYYVSVLLQFQIQDAIPRRGVQKHGREADPFSGDVIASILSFCLFGQNRLTVRDSVLEAFLKPVKRRVA